MHTHSHTRLCHRPCAAGKLGEGGGSKAQFDRRVPLDAQVGWWAWVWSSGRFVLFERLWVALSACEWRLGRLCEGVLGKRTCAPWGQPGAGCTQHIKAWPHPCHSSYPHTGGSTRTLSLCTSPAPACAGAHARAPAAPLSRAARGQRGGICCTGTRVLCGHAGGGAGLKRQLLASQVTRWWTLHRFRRDSRVPHGMMAIGTGQK